MAYCTNCGKELSVDARFCAYCGTSTSSADYRERNYVFDGELHKCPRCGEVINSFEINCPSCGFELRGVKASNAVREFAIKLEAIELKRTNKTSRGLFTLLRGRKAITQTDEQKISLIRSFSIPNTKEDLYEFLILASSNIDIEAYVDKGPIYTDHARLAVSDAWKTMFEKAYQKSLIVLQGDERYEEIKALYTKINKKIKWTKYRMWVITALIYVVLIAVIVITIAVSDYKDITTNQQENERLESIVADIQEALDDEDYAFALMNAERLNFDGYDASLKEDWNIQKNYWINKVISEAAEQGVYLELSTKTEIPTPTDAESQVSEKNDPNALESTIPSATYSPDDLEFSDAISDSMDSFQNSIDQISDVIDQWNGIWNHDE